MIRYFFKESITVYQGGVGFEYRGGQFYIVPEEHLSLVAHVVELEADRALRLVREATEQAEALAAQQAEQAAPPAVEEAKE